jgi:hypothetical protein
MKLDADEKELLESVDRGEVKSSGGGNARAQLATRAIECCLATGNRVCSRVAGPP